MELELLTDLSYLSGVFEFGDMAIAGDCFGAPSGPPVLFVHGGGQTRHAWGASAHVVAQKGAWAVTIDLRGHGDSGWADDGDYSFGAYASDVGRVMRSLPEPPVVIGASAGGFAGLLAIGELNIPAAGLVLVDVVPAPSPAGSRRIIDFMRSGLDGFASLDEVAAAISSYLPHRSRAPNPAGLEKNLRRRSDGRWFWHWDPQIVLKDRTPTPNDVERFYLAAQRLDVPTWLLRGAQSDVVDEPGVSGLLRANPSIEDRSIPNAGHMVAGDENSRFTEQLVDFLLHHRLLQPGE